MNKNDTIDESNPYADDSDSTRSSASTETWRKKKKHLKYKPM